MHIVNGFILASFCFTSFAQFCFMVLTLQFCHFETHTPNKTNRQIFSFKVDMPDGNWCTCMFHVVTLTTFSCCWILFLLLILLCMCPIVCAKCAVMLPLQMLFLHFSHFSNVLNFIYQKIAVLYRCNGV